MCAQQVIHMAKISAANNDLRNSVTGYYSRVGAGAIGGEASAAELPLSRAQKRECRLC